MKVQNTWKTLWKFKKIIGRFEQIIGTLNVQKIVLEPFGQKNLEGLKHFSKFQEVIFKGLAISENSWNVQNICKKIIGKFKEIIYGIESNFRTIWLQILGSNWEFFGSIQRHFWHLQYGQAPLESLLSLSLVIKHSWKLQELLAILKKAFTTLLDTNYYVFSIDSVEHYLPRLCEAWLGNLNSRESLWENIFPRLIAL